MSEYNSQVYESDAGGLKAYITKVFINMAIALGITAAVAFGGYMSLVNGGVFYQILEKFPAVMIVLVVAEFAVVIAFSAGITKFSTGTVRLLMLVYAAITGLTFSYLPLVYGGDTVFQAFLFAAILFGCCAVIGSYTRVDLTKFSGLFMGALFALVLVTVISMFIPALRSNLLIGYLGLGIFLALTAWDMQKIKKYYYQMGEGTIKSNFAVYSAFQLYLDFINVFLYILRILGSRSSNN